MCRRSSAVAQRLWNLSLPRPAGYCEEKAHQAQVGASELQICRSVCKTHFPKILHSKSPPPFRYRTCVRWVVAPVFGASFVGRTVYGRLSVETDGRPLNWAKNLQLLRSKPMSLINKWHPPCRDGEGFYIDKHNEMAGRAAAVVDFVEQCSSSESMEVAHYLAAIEDLSSMQFGFRDIQMFLFKPKLNVLLNLVGLHYCISWLGVPAEYVIEALGSCKISERQVCVQWWKLGRWFYGFRLQDESRFCEFCLGDLAMAKVEEVLRVLHREDVETELKEAAVISMRTSDLHLMNIRDLCHQVNLLQGYTTRLYDYLKNRMNTIAPYLTALGGNLLNFAKQHGSRVQILGAEWLLLLQLIKRSKRRTRKKRSGSMQKMSKLSGLQQH
ncbi:hypothetical protein F0562_000217 [Nyssa sinensis]|uniref:Nop domain-containing protein n=1 Tax=Nyssa sinensis TaxID=561372 RepID=A0A5J5C0T8_9ASTE|nr:hypothetical protein F0562_000217 [Nyssa sinensis]